MRLPARVGETLQMGSLGCLKLRNADHMTYWFSPYFYHSTNNKHYQPNRNTKDSNLAQFHVSMQQPSPFGSQVCYVCTSYLLLFTVITLPHCLAFHELKQNRTRDLCLIFYERHSWSYHCSQHTRNDFEIQLHAMHLWGRWWLRWGLMCQDDRGSECVKTQREKKTISLYTTLHVAQTSFEIF